ncbi:MULTISPECIES: DUF1097 domain-containing protein [Aeromonas]|jgi:hypothetical protein|uniref:DUF1097 domain-containing protein n=3 Tax=Gammaproteobacteria TaxID=1236 RepID=A0A3L0VVK1_ECOLX|nr:MULTISPECIES: DUF1097 domain-containing protein [Aeromonas]MBP6140891.1 DUF1097 domain-containing protein [Aeromonas sp.]ATP11303.1 DUF1097 family protein YcdZ [Aeromonas salmonicida subsp. pectinolytica 34mel]ATU99625.1 DUF1097 domain-containing protein [Aeromonas salmonicida]EQC04010.1 chloride channel protein EriC [Aeromonas salmonicida subsp. pectinolytica 34mel]KTA79338.1 membrane protein [Aeromonas salmonicida]
MSPLIAIAITTGILSAVWGWVAVTLGLISWVGFLGCTSYFASSGGYKALLQTMLCNGSGMLWALLLIHGDAWWGAGMAGYMMTGVVATLMCVQAKQQWLGYIPGTFAGCCATFGAAGEWRLILPSLVIGALFGYLMKASGLWLSQKTQKAQTSTAVVDPA